MKILFVCIGNSCRSPMAESVMRSVATKHGLTDWQIDSTALREWNVGRRPEERASAVLAENGLSSDHVGRQIVPQDFVYFDHIFGMDEGNVADLLALAPSNCSAKIELLGNYRYKELDKIIFDPYFEHGIHGFRRCFDQIVICCENFVKLHKRIRREMHGWNIRNAFP